MEFISSLLGKDVTDVPWAKTYDVALGIEHKIQLTDSLTLNRERLKL